MGLTPRSPRRKIRALALCSGLVMAAAALGGCKGEDDAYAEARAAALGALADVHGRSVDCVRAVLRGDVDAESVPSIDIDWTGCFRLAEDGSTAPELIAAGIPLGDGSWLLSTRHSGEDLTFVAVDVSPPGKAYLPMALEVDTAVAWCWTGTLRHGAERLQDVSIVPCSDDVVEVLGSMTTEVPATAVPTAPPGS